MSPSLRTLRVRASRVALAALVALGAPAGARAAASIGFLYVEGNVGSASGGHAALVLGDDAYHYLLHPDGLLHLTREPFAFLRYRYAILQNRPLHRLDVPTEEASYVAAREGLAREWLRQGRALDEARALRDDRALLDAWLGARSGAPLEGAALFDAAQPEAAAAARLRARIEVALGATFLAGERARVDAALARSAAAADAPTARELLAEREALSALAAAHGLAAAALLPPRSGALSDGERAALDAEGERLAARILALLRGTRPDRGRALLVAAARYQALARSLEEGRLRLLDPMPDVAPILEPRAAALRRAELAALAARYGAVEASLRARMAAQDLGDGALGRLEEVAARREEYRRGAEEGRAVRDPDGRLLPLPRRDVAVAAPAARERLLAARARTRDAEDAAWSALRARHGYRLMTQNCVTQIARALEGALGGRGAAAQALGAPLDAERGAGFVPYVFFASLREHLPDALATRIASFRERALAVARAEEGPRRVGLRESNVLTSRLYRWRDRDTTFLFFTTDPVWPRPLLGLANLGVALAELPVGVASAPFDGARRLQRAAYGALYSAPELAFVNVRKGSFDAATLPGFGLLEAVDAAGRAPRRATARPRARAATR